MPPPPLNYCKKLELILNTQGRHERVSIYKIRFENICSKLIIDIKGNQIK
jgi:hypothetical protein